MPLSYCRSHSGADESGGARAGGESEFALNGPCPSRRFSSQSRGAEVAISEVAPRGRHNRLCRGYSLRVSRYAAIMLRHPGRSFENCRRS